MLVFINMYNLFILYDTATVKSVTELSSNSEIRRAIKRPANDNNINIEVENPALKSHHNLFSIQNEEDEKFTKMPSLTRTCATFPRIKRLNFQPFKGQFHTKISNFKNN